MLQSKLLILLRAFSKDELKRFDAFLLSPYFNQSEKLVKFFRLIEPHQPGFDSNKLKKETLYKALHRGTKYNDSTMRELISELFKLVKVFLAHEGLQKDNLEASVIRYNWLFQHALEKLAEAEVETRSLILEKRVYHDNDYYHHQRLHDLHNFNIIAEKFNDAEHKLLKDFDFFTHIHSHNRDYLINSLYQHIYLLAFARLYNFSLNEVLLNQLETLAESYLNKGDMVIDILFNIYQLVRTNEERYFFELKARFFANERVIPPAVMIEAGIGLENYTVKKIRDGESQFANEAFEIYRFEVENNYHLVNGKMTNGYYNNVAIMAAETRHFDWADDFAETYKNNLPGEYREDTYNYSKAHILFGRKKFKEALRLALCCNFPYLLTKVLVRILVAGAQYELGMLEELKAELAMIAYHLKDEKLTEERKNSFMNFIDIMRQLGDLKGNYNRKKLAVLSTQIDTRNTLVHRQWFKDKIKELQRGTPGR